MLLFQTMAMSLNARIEQRFYGKADQVSNSDMPTNKFHWRGNKPKEASLNSSEESEREEGAASCPEQYLLKISLPSYLRPWNMFFESGKALKENFTLIIFFFISPNWPSIGLYRPIYKNELFFFQASYFTIICRRYIWPFIYKHEHILMRSMWAETF